MREFAALYEALDASTSLLSKHQALLAYLQRAADADAAWAVYFLAGAKPKQVLPTAVLRARAVADAGLSDWLFEACYQAAGDLAETIALVLPAPPHQSNLPLHVWLEQRLLPLRQLSAQAQADALSGWWQELGRAERFLLIKLIGGGFRVGVSKPLVQKALAEHAGVPVAWVAQRMMGYTDAKRAPTPERYRGLLQPEANAQGDSGQPYPFFLAHPLQTAPEELGPREDWQAEWKLDGIRAQLVRRGDGWWLWSRGEELITERFPELSAAAMGLPAGTVLDGEVLVWLNEQPAPFALLQKRITRKTITKTLLAQCPVVFVAYDLLEAGGVDLRPRPLCDRRAGVEALMQALGDAPANQHQTLRVLPVLSPPDWPALAAAREGSRERGVEGLMLKPLAGAYGMGRTQAAGAWWKWKVEPLTVDAVLIYAQAGHGRRAGLYTDYTFAVWNRTPRDAAEAQAVVDAIARREPAREGALQLVPVAKAYSGLTDAEFKQVDQVIRQTTLEKFGPVRSVRPSLVFELGFEAVNASARHKSGVALRFPRMLRLRMDKPLNEADTLMTLRSLA